MDLGAFRVEAEEEDFDVADFFGRFRGDGRSASSVSSSPSASRGCFDGNAEMAS